MAAGTNAGNVYINLLANDLASSKFQQVSFALGGLQMSATNFGSGFSQMFNKASLVAAAKSAAIIGSVFMIGRAIYKSLKEGTEEFIKFQNTMIKVESISNTSTQGILKSFIKLSNATGISIQNMGDSLLEFVKLGYSLEDAMKAFPYISALATAGFTDLGIATEIVGKTMHQFSMNAQDAEKITSILAKGANESAADVESFGSALAYVGNIAGTVGFSLEETSAAIGILTNRGLSASMAGTNLRQALTRLLSPTERAKKIMNDLSFSIVDSNGQYKSLNGIIDEYNAKIKNNTSLTRQQKDNYTKIIFGIRGVNAMYGLANSNLQEFTDSIYEQNYALDVSEKQLQSYQKRSEQASQRTKNAWVSFGKSIAPITTAFKELWAVTNEAFVFFIRSAITAYEVFDKFINRLSTGRIFTKFGDDVKESWQELMNFRNELGKQNIDELTEEFKNFASVSNATSDSIKQNKDRLIELNSEIKNNNELTKEQVEEKEKEVYVLQKIISEQNKAAEQLQKYEIETRKLTNSLKEEEKELEKLNDEYDNAKRKLEGLSDLKFTGQNELEYNIEVKRAELSRKELDILEDKASGRRVSRSDEKERDQLRADLELLEKRKEVEYQAQKEIRDKKIELSDESSENTIQNAYNENETVEQMAEKSVENLNQAKNKQIKIIEEKKGAIDSLTDKMQSEIDRINEIKTVSGLAEKGVNAIQKELDILSNMDMEDSSIYKSLSSMAELLEGIVDSVKTLNKQPTESKPVDNRQSIDRNRYPSYEVPKPEYETGMSYYEPGITYSEGFLQKASKVLKGMLDYDPLSPGGGGYAIGGRVLTDGLAKIHRGETIVPAKVQTPYNNGMMGSSNQSKIENNINVVVEGNITDESYIDKLANTLSVKLNNMMYNTADSSNLGF